MASPRWAAGTHWLTIIDRPASRCRSERRWAVKPQLVELFTPLELIPEVKRDFGVRSSRRCEHLVHEREQRAAEVPALETVQRRVLAFNDAMLQLSIAGHGVDQGRHVHRVFVR